ncbi:hypothetical protein BESB_004080 [Besnoitia besnoiti]|uniref:Uncharacterized protein n=1 Tax=Besnoitia besnoiti TaxID=94643 RepID=A0A2A9MPQ9_BESBE|nr:hypothetical protein BESB_004080 [Besnoitia besnoiti]PFH38067.1 hypothetical protein BESB_004080 [Besnoitia besnoiti]
MLRGDASPGRRTVPERGCSSRSTSPQAGIYAAAEDPSRFPGDEFPCSAQADDGGVACVSEVPGPGSAETPVLRAAERNSYTGVESPPFNPQESHLSASASLRDEKDTTSHKSAGILLRKNDNANEGALLSSDGLEALDAFASSAAGGSHEPLSSQRSVAEIRKEIEQRLTLRGVTANTDATRPAFRCPRGPAPPPAGGEQSSTGEALAAPVLSLENETQDEAARPPHVAGALKRRGLFSVLSKRTREIGTETEADEGTAEAGTGGALKAVSSGEAYPWLSEESRANSSHSSVWLRLRPRARTPSPMHGVHRSDSPRLKGPPQPELECREGRLTDATASPLRRWGKGKPDACWILAEGPRKASDAASESVDSVRSGVAVLRPAPVKLVASAVPAREAFSAASFATSSGSEDPSFYRKWGEEALADGLRDDSSLGSLRAASSLDVRSLSSRLAVVRRIENTGWVRRLRYQESQASRGHVQGRKMPVVPAETRSATWLEEGDDDAYELEEREREEAARRQRQVTGDIRRPPHRVVSSAYTQQQKGRKLLGPPQTPKKVKPVYGRQIFPSPPMSVSLRALSPLNPFRRQPASAELPIYRRQTFQSDAARRRFARNAMALAAATDSSSPDATSADEYEEVSCSDEESKHRNFCTSARWRADSQEYAVSSVAGGKRRRSPRGSSASLKDVPDVATPLSAVITFTSSGKTTPEESCLRPCETQESGSASMPLRSEDGAKQADGEACASQPSIIRKEREQATFPSSPLSQPAPSFKRKKRVLRVKVYTGEQEKLRRERRRRREARRLFPDRVPAVPSNYPLARAFLEALLRARDCLCLQHECLTHRNAAETRELMERHLMLQRGFPVAASSHSADGDSPREGAYMEIQLMEENDYDVPFCVANPREREFVSLLKMVVGVMHWLSTAEMEQEVQRCLREAEEQRRVEMAAAGCPAAQPTDGSRGRESNDAASEAACEKLPEQARDDSGERREGGSQTLFLFSAEERKEYEESCRARLQQQQGRRSVCGDSWSPPADTASCSSSAEDAANANGLSSTPLSPTLLPGDRSQGASHRRMLRDLGRFVSKALRQTGRMLWGTQGSPSRGAKQHDSTFASTGLDSAESLSGSPGFGSASLDSATGLPRFSNAFLGVPSSALGGEHGAHPFLDGVELKKAQKRERREMRKLMRLYDALHDGELEEAEGEPEPEPEELDEELRLENWLGSAAGRRRRRRLLRKKRREAAAAAAAAQAELERQKEEENAPWSGLPVMVGVGIGDFGDTFMLAAAGEACGGAQDQLKVTGSRETSVILESDGSDSEVQNGDVGDPETLHADVLAELGWDSSPTERAAAKTSKAATRRGQKETEGARSRCEEVIDEEGGPPAEAKPEKAWLYDEESEDGQDVGRGAREEIKKLLKEQRAMLRLQSRRLRRIAVDAPQEGGAKAGARVGGHSRSERGCSPGAGDDLADSRSVEPSAEVPVWKREADDDRRSDRRGSLLVYRAASPLEPLILLQEANFWFKMKGLADEERDSKKSFFARLFKNPLGLGSQDRDARAQEKRRREEQLAAAAALAAAGLPFPKQVLRLPPRFFFVGRPAAEVILVVSSLSVRRRTMFNCERLANLLSCKGIVYYLVDANNDGAGHEAPNARLLRRWKRQRILRSAPHTHHRGILIPQVVVDGQSIGTYNEVQQMEDDGVLDPVFARGRCPTCLQMRALEDRQCGWCHTQFRELLSVKRQDEGELKEMYRGHPTRARRVLNEGFDRATTWVLYHKFCALCGAERRAEQPWCPQCHMTTRDIALARLLGIGIYRATKCPQCGEQAKDVIDNAEPLFPPADPRSKAPPLNSYLVSSASPLCLLCGALLTYFMPIASKTRE